MVRPTALAYVLVLHSDPLLYNCFQGESPSDPLLGEDIQLHLLYKVSQNIGPSIAQNWVLFVECVWPIVEGKTSGEKC